MKVYLQVFLLLAGIAQPCLAQATEAGDPAKVDFKHKLAADFGTCPDGHKALKDVPVVYGLYLGLFDKKTEELDAEERELRRKVERGEVVMGGDVHGPQSPKFRVLCSQCGFYYDPGPLPAAMPEAASWEKDEEDTSKFRLPFEARVLALPRLQPAEGSNRYSQTLAADGKSLRFQSTSYSTPLKVDEVLAAMRKWITTIKGDPSHMTAESTHFIDQWEFMKDELTLSITRRKTPPSEAGTIDVTLFIAVAEKARLEPDQR